MAIQTLNTIKNWFRTGLKPTRAQFWDTWDSFRHKNDKVPVGDLEGIDELLNSKTDKSDFKTINGESILGFGNIGLNDGGSKNFQQVLNNGSTTSLTNKEYDVTINNTDSSRHATNFLFANGSVNNSIYDDDFGAFQLDRGNVIIIRQTDIHNAPSTTRLLFETPMTIPYGQADIKIPAKPNGTYTLATLDDITGGSQNLQQVLNTGNVSKTEAIFDLNPEISDPYKSKTRIGCGSVDVYGSHYWYGEMQVASTQITSGAIRVNRNDFTNTFLFHPQGNQGNTFFAPNKSGGVYTLATTDETNAYSFTQNQANIAGFRTTTVSYQVPSAYTRVGNIVTMKIPVKFTIEANTNYANVQIDTGIYHVAGTAEVGTFSGSSNAFRTVSGTVRSNGTTSGQTLVLDVIPPAGYTNTEIFNCVAMVIFEVAPKTNN